MSSPKARLAKLRRETVSLQEVAAQFDASVDDLRADLERHGVRVIGDRVHIDALESAIRGRAPVAATGAAASDDVTLAREQLAPYGLGVVAADEGRSLTLQLAATKGSRLLYSPSLWDPDDQKADEAFAPVRVTKEAPCLARVYVTSKMQAGAARYAPAGYFGERAPDIYLFLLRDPPTLWSANAGELRAFEEVALASKDDEERSPSEGYRFGFILAPGKLRKGRRNALRLWMSRKWCELSLDGRVHTVRHRLIEAPPRDAEEKESEE